MTITGVILIYCIVGCLWGLTAPLIDIDKKLFIQTVQRSASNIAQLPYFTAMALFVMLIWPLSVFLTVKRLYVDKVRTDPAYFDRMAESIAEHGLFKGIADIGSRADHYIPR